MAKSKLSFQAAFAEIKKAIAKFNDTPAAADVSAANDLKEYTTDGEVKLKIDKLEVGGKVYQEDGVTLLDAGVTLADGTVLEIGTDGVITAVTVPGTETAKDPKVEMEAMAAKFAAGTPEERITNLETMCQAMMQYCFGWKIEEATRKTIEAEAIKVFETIAPPTQMVAQFTEQIAAEKKARAADNQKFSAILTDVLNLFQQFAEEPNGDPVKKPNNAVAAPTKAEKAAAVIAAARESKDLIGAD